MSSLPQAAGEQLPQVAIAAPKTPLSTSRARHPAPLAFTEPDGPLLVVCGLHGGAGTSTLAHLLAHYAAAASTVPVLLCEAPAASGGQLALGAPQSAVSLDSLAVTLAAGNRPQDGWWAQRENLRVLATAPAVALEPPGGVDPAGTLQAAAREHGLTVVDGGTIRDHSTRELLAAATHVIWTLTIHPGGVQHAHEILASSLAPPLAAAQAFALRTDRRSDALTRAVRDLRRLADTHCARQLLLLPYTPAVTQRPMDLSAEPLARSLSTLSRFLHAP